MAIDYTALSLDGVVAEIDAMSRDAQAAFGGLEGRQLNWRPDADKWSVAQCLDHLLNANREMFQALDAAVEPAGRRTIWQRLPLLPGLFGRLMVQSQTPGSGRTFTAPRKAHPASSDIDAGIVARFIAQQREAAARIRGLDGGDAARIVMVSPFVRFITYSVLDGCRLVAAHERRHLEQARRVTEAPGFPRPS